MVISITAQGMTGKEGRCAEMTQMKLGGIVLSGIGAFFILNRSINAVRDTVYQITEASKWKAYYECKRPDPLAPGYERTEINDEPKSDGGDPPNAKKKDGSKSTAEIVAEAVIKGMKTFLSEREKAAKSANYGPLNANYEEYSDNVVQMPREEIDNLFENDTNDEKDEDQ